MSLARFVGDFRSADREYAERLRLGDRLELIPYLPRQDVLALQRDSEALLLLIPEADGRGKGVLSGKVFEYLAAERPVIAAVPTGRRGRRAASLDRSRSRRGARRRRRPGGRCRRARGPLAGRGPRRRASLAGCPPAALAAGPSRGACLAAPGARVSVALPARRTAEARQSSASATALVDGLLFATVFTITFAKVRWDVGGADLNISDVTAGLFVLAFAASRLDRRDGALPGASWKLLVLLRALPRRLPGRLLQPRDHRRS